MYKISVPICIETMDEKSLPKYIQEFKKGGVDRVFVSTTSSLTRKDFFLYTNPEKMANLISSLKKEGFEIGVWLSAFGHGGVLAHDKCEGYIDNFSKIRGADGKEADEISNRMQSYVLQGGVYGNLDNRVAVQQNKRGGRIGYILSRIFLPYHSLKFTYPILQKHKWLLPFMQVRRWFRLLLKGRLKKSLNELNASNDISQEKQSETAKLLRSLGLQ